jgi:colicin import membrane protein
VALGAFIRGKLKAREPGVVVSAAAHAGVIAVGLIGFASAPKPFTDAQEAIAVEVVDPSALNEIMRGERTAEAVQTNPRPRVDRQSEISEERPRGEQPRDVPTPPTRPAAMPTADRDEAPPPTAQPTPRPPQRPQAAQAEPRPEPQERPQAQPPREATRPQPQPELRRDQLAALAEQAELQAQRERAEQEQRAAQRAREEAEARTRAQAQAEARARAEQQARERAQQQAEARAKAEAEAKAKAEAEARAKAAAEARARREAEQAARFNPNDISRLLASREQPQASGSTGREVNRVASLGTQSGQAQRMSPSLRAEISDLLQRQIERCYSPPPGATGGRATNPFVSVQLAQDGTLQGQPRVARAGTSAVDQAIAGAALRAVQRCAPYRIPAKFAPYYSDWQALSVEFVPPDL